MKQKDIYIYIYIYNFQHFETIRPFDESSYPQKATIVEVEEDQSNLLKNIVEFNNKSRLKSKEGKHKKRNTYEGAYALYISNKSKEKDWKH